MQTQSLPGGGGSVTLALFTDVRNSPQLRSQAAAGKIPAALLATALVGIAPSTDYSCTTFDPILRDKESEFMSSFWAWFNCAPP